MIFKLNLDVGEYRYLLKLNALNILLAFRNEYSNISCVMLLRRDWLWQNGIYIIGEGVNALSEVSSKTIPLRYFVVCLVNDSFPAALLLPSCLLAGKYPSPLQI